MFDLHNVDIQLPAVMNPGLTIVIAPLVSLLQDQVSQLVEVGVEAAYFKHDVSGEESSAIFNSKNHHTVVLLLELNASPPEIKILYVTPEKVNTSQAFKNLMIRLWNRGFLERSVCLLSW